MAKGFDMGAFLASAVGPDLGTSGPKLETIDIGLLRADEKNFYAVAEDSVAELSANIELVGLQQPLNVRPDGEGGYIVISGHRRLAALKLLVSEGKSQFSSVPCMVVESGSEALNELRLIYGNANTRQLSNWELSRQAERVQELFYQLKEEGVEFPGRMRDHVAAACQVSKSKLSRLKVIGEQLEICAEQWQAGTLSEALAYELAQCPVELQWRIRDSKVKVEKLQADKVRRVRGAWAEGTRWEMSHVCTVSGKVCGHGDVALRRDLNAASWDGLCKGDGCCLKCKHGLECKSYSSPCDRLCRIAADKKAAEKAKEDEATKAAEQKRKAESNEEFRVCLRPYIEALDHVDIGKRKLSFGYSTVTAAGLREWYEDPDKCGTAWQVKNQQAKDLIVNAELLGCSVDFLLGRPSQSASLPALPEGEPRWMEGEPTKAGRYWVRIDMHDGCGLWTEDMRWTGEQWRGLVDDSEVVGWWPLPEE